MPDKVPKPKCVMLMSVMSCLLDLKRKIARPSIAHLTGMS